MAHLHPTHPLDSLTSSPPAERQEPAIELDALNRELAEVDASRFVRWATDTFGQGLVMSTSFGIQSAAMLHLVTREMPEIPVIWVDTGYLPPETYRFAEQLRERLQLNLKVYQAALSPARMEAIYGRLWEPDEVESLDHYDRIRKVEPMQRALRELGASAWLSGIRAEQSDYRKTLPLIGRQSGRYKLSPLLHWTRQDVHAYLKQHDLPHHPLFEQGYASVGDWHSSRPLAADDDHERHTRFRGLKQECGLHLPLTPEAAESLDASKL